MPPLPFFHEAHCWSGRQIEPDDRETKFMTNSHNTLLVVDDKPMNVELLQTLLEADGYLVVTATDGVEACTILEQGQYDFQAILLDRMMPNMNGMEVLGKIKAHPTLQILPIIMITAASEAEEIREGIEAGAYYYMTKPFKKNILLAIVRSAVNEYVTRCSLQEELRQSARTWRYLQSGTFCFRDVPEARDLATLLANGCPDPQKVILGLLELLVNAVEHGNLQITYEEKTRLNEQNELEREIAHRLSLPDHSSKYVVVDFERSAESIQITITDQGQGFDWRSYLDLDADRAFDSHGRGIAMARMMSFDSLEYQGTGNRVICTIAVPGQVPSDLAIASTLPATV